MSKKILILSGISWTDTIQRHQRIAKYLVKNGNEVIFVESIMSSKFSIKKLIEKISLYLKKIVIVKKLEMTNTEANVYNAKVVNPHGIFVYYNHMKVKKLLKKIGNNYDVIINYLPIETTDYIIKNCTYKKLIYDCVRDFDNWGGYPKNLNIYEKKLLKESEVILTDSYYLKNKISNLLNYKEKVIQILPTLSQEEYDIYIKNYTKKFFKINSLTYFGSVDKHIDIELLNKLANEYEINIIGKIESNLKISDRIKVYKFTSNLTELAKIISKISDAIIIPYIGNMDGVIPAKLIQSLATGLPVYISSFYDSKILKENLYTFENIEDLKNLINNFDESSFEKIRNRNKILMEKNIEDKSFEKILGIIS
ncbi:MAG: hypothetical protein RSF67_06730 [Clostridia bacterium]